jgi:hypothetical protein
VTKKTPEQRTAKAGGRKRRPIVLVAINEPDPEIVARAAVPLLLDFVRRQRAKLKGPE